MSALSSIRTETVKDTVKSNSNVTAAAAAAAVVSEQSLLSESSKVPNNNSINNNGIDSNSVPGNSTSPVVATKEALSIALKALQEVSKAVLSTGLSLSPTVDATATSSTDCHSASWARNDPTDSPDIADVLSGDVSLIAQHAVALTGALVSALVSERANGRVKQLERSLREAEENIQETYIYHLSHTHARARIHTHTLTHTNCTWTCSLAHT